MIGANLGAFTRQEVLGRVHQIVGNPRFVDLREGSQRGGSVARFLLPIAIGPVRGHQRIDVLDGLDLREVVDIGRARQAAEIGLFAGIGFDGFLEGLIRGDPKILAQRIVVAVDAHVPRAPDESAKALLTDEIGAVQFIIPNPRGNTHLAYAAAIGRNQRAEFGHHFADVHIEQAIFHVKRAHRLIRLGDLQLQARFGACHFIAHGAQGVIVVRGSLGQGGGSGGKCQENGREPKGAHYWRPPDFASSCAGGGRIGGRSVDVSFFWTSNSEVRMAGEAAETGTEPDSAPQ